MPDYSESGRHDLNRAVRQILLIQGTAASIVLMAFVACFALGASENLAMNLVAAGYGSLLALIGTMISARSARRSGDFAVTNSNMAMVPIFSGVVLKLVVVGGGIGLGLVWLGLDAIPVLVAFAVVKMSSMFSILAHPIVKS
ncbi:MAG: hypothetical protein OXD44_10700 [Gammaproteobacteria bacterium]|nr:hypothetical protein [Gammaproteobacteria bacterium]MCY4226882.1 hypothetical protein [Gammaproteobacteria bacterium]MCY4314134.1 hypothetical protein [Gammaproteobacteria bacterium]